MFRIIAGSAADRCFPRLNEGDQVLKINGQNISQWSYGNVVNFIRSLRTYGEMTLTIKPNGTFEFTTSFKLPIFSVPMC